MRKCLPRASMATDCRSRWLHGCGDVHTRHRQPTTGTPVDVPLPRKVTRIREGILCWVSVILSRRRFRRNEKHGGEGPGGWAARGALPTRSFAAMVRVPAAIPAAQDDRAMDTHFRGPVLSYAIATEAGGGARLRY